MQRREATLRSRQRAPNLVLVVSIAGGALLVAGCGDGSEAARRRADALLERAGELTGQGLDMEAVALLRGEVASLPDAERPRIWAEMARNSHRVGAMNLALIYAQRALGDGATGSASGDLTVRAVLGDAQRALEDFESARATLRAVLDADPSQRLARLGLARVAWRLGDVEAALADFDAYFESAPTASGPGSDATASAPDDGIALLEYGRALRAAGRLQDAADRFAELLERDPAESEPYAELAQTLYRLRRRGAARLVEFIYKEVSQRAFEEHVQEKLLESGATGFSLAQRGLNLIERRRFLEAFRALRQAVRVERDDARAAMALADLALRFGRTSEARAVLEQALDGGAAPRSGLQWKLASVHLERREAAAASAASTKCMVELATERRAYTVEKGRAPDFSAALFLSRSALESGQPDSALSATALAERAAPGRWEPEYWAGRAELARGDARAALMRFQQALQRGGQGFADLLYWTGRAFEAAGRAADAVTWCERCLAIDATHRKALETLVDLVAADAQKAAALRGRLDEIVESERTIEALRATVDAQTLEASAQACRGIGAALLAIRRPAAYDWLFLAADLAPDDPMPVRLLLTGLTRPQDVFFRWHYLARLSRGAPDDAPALRELAELCLRFNVRLADAERFAARLHALDASAVSYRLLGEIAAARGRIEDARARIEEGARAFPQDAPLARALAALDDGER